jgi:GNAT superfamily N-acetyltransferase
MEHLWLRPAWAGRGIGRSLFEHAVRTARLRGARNVTIESDPHAEGFYLHMGARRVGEVAADVDGARRRLPKLVFELRDA